MCITFSVFFPIFHRLNIHSDSFVRVGGDSVLWRWQVGDSRPQLGSQEVGPSLFVAASRGPRGRGRIFGLLEVEDIERERQI
jgi:hypothetical protein